MRWILRCAIGTCVLALGIVVLAAVVLFGGGGELPVRRERAEPGDAHAG